MNMRHFFISAKCETPIFAKANGARTCGFFIGNGLTWSKANDMCKSLGAQLPVINSAQENQGIANAAVKRYYWPLRGLFWVVYFVYFPHSFKKQ